MSVITAPIEVDLDGGQQLRATADQRDFARAEGQGVSSATIHTWTRAVAWAALTRTGQYSGTWQRFNDVDCIEARDFELEVPDGDEDGLDPGQSTATGGAA